MTTYTKATAMATAARNVREALAQHSYSAAMSAEQPAQLPSEFGGVAYTAARRVAALKAMPMNRWEQAAEDVLVCAAQQVLPKEFPQRLRRLGADHVPAIVQALRTWRAIA